MVEDVIRVDVEEGTIGVKTAEVAEVELMEAAVADEVIDVAVEDEEKVIVIVEQKREVEA